eukprot:scaffold244545_cov17-Prasinocladus_malaysianus.AAC.1
MHARFAASGLGVSPVRPKEENKAGDSCLLLTCHGCRGLGLGESASSLPLCIDPERAGSPPVAQRKCANGPPAFQMMQESVSQSDSQWVAGHMQMRSLGEGHYF